MTLGDFERVANECIRLKEENKELKEKYLGAVADYETTMSENKQLKDNFDSKVDVLTKIEKYCYKFRECTPRLADILDILKEVQDNGRNFR